MIHINDIALSWGVYIDDERFCHLQTLIERLRDGKIDVSAICALTHWYNVNAWVSHEKYRHTIADDIVIDIYAATYQSCAPSVDARMITLRCSDVHPPVSSLLTSLVNASQTRYVTLVDARATWRVALHEQPIRVVDIERHHTLNIERDEIVNAWMRTWRESA